MSPESMVRTGLSEASKKPRWTVAGDAFNSWIFCSAGAWDAPWAGACAGACAAAQMAAAPTQAAIIFDPLFPLAAIGHLLFFRRPQFPEPARPEPKRLSARQQFNLLRSCGLILADPPI